MRMTANTRGYNGENFNKFLNKREEENTTCPCVVFNCLPKRILFLLEKSQMKVDITEAQNISRAWQGKTRKPSKHALEIQMIAQTVDFKRMTTLIVMIRLCVRRI